LPSGIVRITFAVHGRRKARCFACVMITTTVHEGRCFMRGLAIVAIAALAVGGAALALLPRARAETQTDRGKYLVVVASCNDCHTPGFFLGKPDTAKYLGGSDVGFEIPGLGVFAGRNITPDKETGIGNWTDEQIAAAITTGKRPDGRLLAPIMPYVAFSYMTKEDVAAIVAFLRSVPPVKNEVAGPFKPGEKVSIFTFRVLPPGQTAMEAPK
jgi:mono/diheme cytochrome c family protein